MSLALVSSYVIISPQSKTSAPIVSRMMDAAPIVSDLFGMPSSYLSMPVGPVLKIRVSTPAKAIIIQAATRLIEAWSRSKH